jgi:cellulose synthase (UDP-forming)
MLATHSRQGLDRVPNRKPMPIRPTSIRAAGPQFVPSEVTDDEKYWYFGPQQRWFLVVRFITFVSLIASLSRFSIDDPHLSFMMIIVLMLVLVSLVSLYTSTRPRRLTLASHERRVRSWEPVDAPAVDVFLPTAGEPLSVLDNTYRHAAAIEYPGPVNVLVLDDGGRDEVRELAERYGFRYLSRPDRGRLKKAGNLSYGYRHSAGEVIAILDADFAARPDFLRNLVPYLDDPSVGIVQSPQFFETRGGGPWLQRAAGAAQELFYRWVQPSRDALGAPICVGTCAVYRRRALEDAGGFAQIEHSEDVHTGFAIMTAGYEVRYVPIVLAKGLCPDGIHPFVNQQYRWCVGSMSLMVSRDFQTMPMSWRQRLCFWSGFGYYISTAVTAFTALVPPIYLLWLQPHEIHDRNYLLLLPVVLAYPLIIAMHRGWWRLSVLRVQLAYSFAHALAVWDTWRGHTSEWVPTGSVRRTVLSERVNRVMVGWLLITQCLLWAGIARDLMRHTLTLGQMYPLIGFAVVAIYVHLPLIGSTVKRARPAIPLVATS